MMRILLLFVALVTAGLLGIVFSVICWMIFFVPQLSADHPQHCVIVTTLYSSDLVSPQSLHLISEAIPGLRSLILACGLLTSKPALLLSPSLPLLNPLRLPFSSTHSGAMCPCQ